MMYFAATCVGLNEREVEALVSAVDRELVITAATFRKHIGEDEWNRLSRQLGYRTYSERGGITLDEDYHVKFSRSLIAGRRCYIMCHSSIEYIYTKDGRIFGGSRAS